MSWDNSSTQRLYAYLNAALRPADRLYLLDGILDNLSTNGSQAAPPSG